MVVGRRGFLTICLAALPALAGCGFQPLYGPASGGGKVSAELASVEVENRHDRLGQLVRNEIVAQITPAGGPVNARYNLVLILAENESSIVDAGNTDTLRQRYIVNASFRLIDNTVGKPVYTGKTFAQASYDRIRAPVANLQARDNARLRVSRQIGGDIATRLAAFFASR